MTGMEPIPAQPDAEDLLADDLVGDIDVDNTQVLEERFVVEGDGLGPSDDAEWVQTREVES